MKFTIADYVRLQSHRPRNRKERAEFPVTSPIVHRSTQGEQVVRLRAANGRTVAIRHTAARMPGAE